MKQRYKNLVIVFLSVFTLISCDKNEVIPPNPNPNPTPHMRYANATLTNGLDITEYELEQTYNYVSDNSLPNGFVFLTIGNANYKTPIAFNIENEVYIDDIKHYPFVEITNLLSFYEESSITNYLKNQSIAMNTIVRTDSYSSALSIVTDGMAISILDDNSI